MLFFVYVCVCVCVSVVWWKDGTHAQCMCMQGEREGEINDNDKNKRTKTTFEMKRERDRQTERGEAPSLLFFYSGKTANNDTTRYIYTNNGRETSCIFHRIESCEREGEGGDMAQSVFREQTETPIYLHFYLTINSTHSTQSTHMILHTLHSCSPSSLLYLSFAVFSASSGCHNPYASMPKHTKNAGPQMTGTKSSERYV